jgi:ADP-ribose pyrophosphatase YjhB (NUDIX family)
MTTLTCVSATPSPAPAPKPRPVPRQERAGSATAKGGAHEAGKAGTRPRGKRVEETSAGGLVRSADGTHALLIGRHDKRGRTLWSLPKGHIEPNESPEQAAVREVREETGIEAVIVRHLGTIDFWFMAEGRRIHKTVHHYLMDAVGGVLTAQTAEVDEVEWFPLGLITTQLAYTDERKLIKANQDSL